MSGAVLVRGEASAEEIAAVVAALHAAADGHAPESGYARWRRQRLAALRSCRSVDHVFLVNARSAAGNRAFRRKT